jgi:hypothetical protein
VLPYVLARICDARVPDSAPLLERQFANLRSGSRMENESGRSGGLGERSVGPVNINPRSVVDRSSNVALKK